MYNKIKILTVVGIILSVFFVIPVSASTDDYITKYGITYNELFMKYPIYLYNNESEAIIKDAINAYNTVISKYDENDEFISAIKTGSSDGLEIIIRNIGSALGLTDSYYETCLDKATLELIQDMYSDEASVSSLSVVKDAAKHFKWIKNVSDLSTGTIDIIASNIKNLNKNQVEEITKTLKSNYGKVLNPATDAMDVAKYISTACVIADVQIEMIDLLIDKADSDTVLYKGLTRLRNDMTSGIEAYTLKTFIENKMLGEISSKILSYGWDALDIGTGSVVLGKLVMKTAVWVLFDVIFPHPDADTVISNMILTTYVMEIGVMVSEQRLVFDSPFFVSDMEDYKTLYSTYLSCINTTLDSTKELAKTTGDESKIVTAKNAFNASLPNYDAYITYCMDELSSTSANDRIERIINDDVYISIPSGKTVALGTSLEDIEFDDSLPLTSDNCTLWSVSGGDIKIFDTVVIPNLYNHDSLNVNGYKIIIEGDFYNQGILVMNNDSDYILVDGNYIHSYNHDTHSTYITAGTLEVKKNISGHEDFYCKSRFNPSGTHKTILSGEKAQTVTDCNFNILELTNTSEEGITFENISNISKEIYSCNSTLINSNNLYLQNDAKIRNNIWNDDITLVSWTTNEVNVFNGNVYSSNIIFNSPQIFNKDLSIGGDAIFNATQNINGNMRIAYGSGNLLLNSDIYVSGDLVQDGTLDLNGHEIIVDGDFSTGGGGNLKMENDDDYILLNGNYYHDTHSTYITAGTLEIKGNVYSYVNFNRNSTFNPSGTHKTILSGEKAQTVTDCNFNILELTNTSEEGITFSDTTTVNNRIIQPVGTVINKGNNLYLQNIPAFKDCGTLNTDINTCNGNAKNVIPTWLDFENYLNSTDNKSMAIVLNEKLNSTSFNCELYFSEKYDKPSAVAILAFYGENGRFVQVKLKEVDVESDNNDVTIDFENKDYTTYKLMILDSMSSLKPLIET